MWVMTKTKEKKDTSLDDIYSAYKEELTETFVEKGTIDIPAVGVLEEKDGTYSVFPLHDMYVSADEDGIIQVNSEQLLSCFQQTQKDGSSVAMFISAVPSRTESEFGAKDALLLVAQKSDGNSIMNLWLKDLEGQDGVLTESVGHGYETWNKGAKEDSLEAAVGMALINAVWKEYTLISKVEPLFDDKN